MEKGQSRDQTKKAIALLEVLLGSTQPLSLDNINFMLTDNGKEAIPRSSFFKLKKKINDGNIAFQIVAQGDDATERGYVVKVSDNIFGNKLSEIYRFINSDLYEGFNDARIISDDDNYYYPLKPSFEKIKYAIDKKKTVSFQTYNFDDGMWKHHNDVTPYLIVVKPNKVWFYFKDEEGPKKANLFMSHSFKLSEKAPSGMSLNEYRRRYINDHGYFKDELKPLRVEFKTLEEHVQFHNILIEQNFLKYYKSWSDKKNKSFVTEFETLSEEQVKLFKTFEKLIKK